MYMFGITHEKPTAAEARRRNRICRAEGGTGYIELNRQHGDVPSVNGGNYQGWYEAPNRGEPFDSDLKRRVLARIATFQEQEV
jgi:hypothetical protein